MSRADRPPQTIFGEYDAAEAHLSGVVTLLDLKYQQGTEDTRFYVDVQKRILLMYRPAVFARARGAPSRPLPLALPSLPD